MRGTRFLRHCSIVTAALLLSGITAPLYATGFELRLQAVPVVQELGLSGVGSTPVADAAGLQNGDRSVHAAASAAPFALHELRSAAHWSALDAAQAGDASDQAAGRRGVGSRTWRWLKKYWWVPVLVAGAIVVVADDGDDSPDDEED